MKTVRSKLQKISQAVQKQLMSWIKPASGSLIIGTLKDVTRSKSQLISEKALLRQQLIVLNRQNKPSPPQAAGYLANRSWVGPSS